MESMLNEQWNQILPAIIGVVGTLLGTILGWILSNLSKRGKLRIFSTWKDEFQCPDRMGSMEASKSREGASLYTYHLTLDLYNNCGEPRIMRMIEIAFIKDKQELFRDTPDDDSTAYISCHARFYSKVQPITIPAKTVYTMSLHGGLWKTESNFQKIWNTNKIVLTYRDDKDKEKKVLLKKCDFSKYFENQTI